MKALLCIALMVSVAWLLCEAESTSAHDLPLSEMMLVAGEDRLHLEIVLNAPELMFFSELDLDKNGHVNPAELAGREEQVARRVVDCVEIWVADHLVHADVAGIVPNHNTHHLTIRAHYPVDATRATVDISSRLAAITHAAHLLQITFRRPLAIQKASLAANRSKARFAGFAPEPTTATDAEGFLEETESPEATTWSWWRRIGLPVSLSLLVGSLLTLVISKP